MNYFVILEEKAIFLYIKAVRRIEKNMGSKYQWFGILFTTVVRFYIIFFLPYLSNQFETGREVRRRLGNLSELNCSRLALTLHRKTDKDMAKIYVNGDAQEVSLPLNVSELISQNNVQQPEMVSVQVNEEFAEREDWEKIQLKEGDRIDFLYFMGGGSPMHNA